MSEEAILEHTPQEQIHQEQTLQNQETVESQTEENPNQINWKKFREERKKEREQTRILEEQYRKSQEEKEAIKKAMEAMLTLQPRYDEQPHYEAQGGDDLDKKLEKLLEKKEKEWERKRKEEEHATYPQRLKNQYPDLHAICSDENLDYLDFHYPEVAAPFKLLPDGYEKWEGIYKAIKRFLPNPQSQKENSRIEKNLQKPVALSRPGMTQTGDHAPSLFLTEDQRKKNWERMQRIMKS